MFEIYEIVNYDKDILRYIAEEDTIDEAIISAVNSLDLDNPIPTTVIKDDVVVALIHVDSITKDVKVYR